MITEKPYLQKTLFWSLFALFAAVYTMQVVLNHYFMRTYAMDYGFYNQAFWDFAHFRMNSPTILGVSLGSYFQVHPTFTLPLLSPLYWIFSPLFGTYSLLIIQNIFIVLGGYGTYLGERKPAIIGLPCWHSFITTCCGDISAHWPRIYIDATVVSSTVPGFSFFDKKKFVPAGIIFLQLPARRICPSGSFIAITLILTYRTRLRLVAAGFGIFSVLYLFRFRILIRILKILTFLLGICLSALGETGQAIHFILKHPLETARLMVENQTGNLAFDHIKAEFYLVFILSGGVLLLLRPVYLIMFIPLIAQKVLNDSFVRWGILGFYSIEIVSVLTLAVFMATQWKDRLRLRYLLYIVLCLSTLRITYLKMQERTVCIMMSGRKIYSCSFYQPENDVRKIRRQTKAVVPKDANLCAMQDIVPQLAYRRNISVFPFVREADYIVLLLNGNPYPLKEEEYMSRIERYVNDPAWEKALNDYPLVILKKK
jgi:uncharacterized membrane protein